MMLIMIKMTFLLMRIIMIIEQKLMMTIVIMVQNKMIIIVMIHKMILLIMIMMMFPIHFSTTHLLNNNKSLARSLVGQNEAIKLKERVSRLGINSKVTSQ